VTLAEFGEDALRRNLEDLGWLEATARAHHHVIDAVAQQGPLVPMRLATVYSGDEGIAAMLGERGADFRSARARVSGAKGGGATQGRAGGGAAARGPPGGAPRGGGPEAGGGGGRPGGGAVMTPRQKKPPAANRPRARTSPPPNCPGTRPKPGYTRLRHRSSPG